MPGEVDIALREAFVGGMSHAACTVNVITTDGPAGRAGVTVSAMSSVSADTSRPTLLVCIHHLSPAAQTIIDNGVFCVNVLKDSQGYISDTFAGRFRKEVDDKFDCAKWAAMASGVPRVVDPLVAFDCQVVSSIQVGTHYVFFGEVGDIFVAGRGSPLIYANRAYGSTNRIDSANTIGAARSGSETVLSVGCFHTFGPFIMPNMIAQMTAHDPTVSVRLVEGDQRRVQESLLSGETELALLYDLNLPKDLACIPLTYLDPYVLLSEGHALADLPELSPDDLADHPMVLLDAPPSRDYFTGLLEKEGVTPQIAHRSSNFEMVRGMVGHGLGFALLATKPASSMTYDGKSLTSRRLRLTSEPAQVVLARRAEAELSRPAEQFLWLCRDVFGLED